jgi:hypothetical protein
MATFPSKVNFVTGDILTATNMNDVGGAINLLEGAQFAAGVNKFLNSDFSIWQRGTSFTLTTATETYCADRYSFAAYGTSTAATVTRQAFTPGTAPVAGYEGQYFARLTNFATATAWQIRQRIENVQTFAGQTVTFSFWAKAGTAISSAVTVQAIQNFGSGGSTAVTTNFTSVGSITTGWARYTYTLAIPAVTGKTIGTSSYLDITIFQNASLTNSNAIDTWGWQIEAASTASNFATATGTVQGELAACQRYYFRTPAGGNQTTAFGANLPTTSIAVFNTQLPVPLRGNPTFGSGTAASLTIGYGANVSVNAATIVGDVMGPNYAQWYITAAGVPFTTGGVARATSSATTGWVEFSAEL